MSRAGQIMNYQDVLDERAVMAFMDIVGKLDKFDVYGLLDILNEPDIEVIDEELDIAAECYHVRRIWYPRYTIG